MEKIPTIAFEGVNRTGKGTQIELLKHEIMDMNLHSVELRGDGTRNGFGDHDGDPLSPWWQKYSKRLRESGTNEEWHEAAYQLAIDFISWRESAKDLGKDIILLDRSLLSRATFVIDREEPVTEILEIEDLYPIQSSGRKIGLESVLPDIIFELVVPKDILIDRLDHDDPKFKFRAGIIESSYEHFYAAKYRLPTIVRDRIISIDSSKPIHMVFDDVLENLNREVELFKQHKH